MPDPTPVELAGGTSTSATVTVNFTAQTAGTILLLTVGADWYRTTSGAGRPESTSWIYLDGQEGNLGHYAWYKVSTGSETSVQYTLGSGANSAYSLAKLDNIAASSFLGGKNINASAVVTNLVNHTTAALTPASGDRWCVTAMVSSTGNATSGPYSWAGGGSFTKLSERYTTTGYRPGVTIGTVTLDGGTAVSSVVTFASATQVNQGMSIVQAWKVATGGATQYAVTGTIPIVSVATGSPTALEVTAGTIPIVSVATATPTSKQGVAGTVTVTSAASGSANVRTPAAGSIPIVSTASGAANLGGSLAASGSIAITTASSGAVTLRATAAGTVPVTSTATGSANSLEPSGGTAAITSGLSGAPTVLAAASGSTPVVSTTSGSVNVQSGGALAASGTVTVTSTASGAAGSRQVVTGTVTVTTASTGAAGSRQTVTGSIAVTTTVSGDAGQRQAVTALVAIVSTTSGAAGRTVSAAGVVVIVSTASGSPLEGGWVGPVVPRVLVAYLRDEASHVGRLQDNSRYEAKVR